MKITKSKIIFLVLVIILFVTTGMYFFSLDNIKGGNAVGIVVKDGFNLDKIYQKLTLVEDVNCIEECGPPHVEFEGSKVSLYVIAPESAMSRVNNLPLSGALYWSEKDGMPNPKERLIQMIEEGGNAKYKIFYE